MKNTIFTILVAMLLTFLPTFYVETILAHESEDVAEPTEIQSERIDSESYNQEETELESEDTSNDDADGAEIENEHSDKIKHVADDLKNIATKHEDIRADLDEIAEEEYSSGEKVSKAVKDLDEEGRVKRFFFGPDYKSLGELRSTMVTTENHIERLERTFERTTDSVTRQEIEVQIDALKEIASSTNNYVAEHESSFSLFGWLVKIFVK